MTNLTDLSVGLDKPIAQHVQVTSDEPLVHPQLETSEGYFKSPLFVGTVLSGGFGMIGVRTSQRLSKLHD